MDNYLIKFGFLVAAIVLLFLYVRYMEKKSLYSPLRTIEATPMARGLSYEDVVITTEDGIEIAGWFIPADAPRATIIFCHGNGGNISHRLEKIKIMNNLHLDVLIFDYRGYGLSKGSPSEEGLYLDADAMFNYLINVKKVPAKKIVVFGESLGSAVAVELASKYDLGGVITEGGFSSVRDMAKRILPFIPTFVYKSKFDSLEKIKHIKSPKLILHSLGDEIVPFELGERLFHAAAEPKEFVKMRGSHNDAFLSSQDLFITKIDSFINRL